MLLFNTTKNDCKIYATVLWYLCIFLLLSVTSCGHRDDNTPETPITKPAYAAGREHSTTRPSTETRHDTSLYRTIFLNGANSLTSLTKSLGKNGTFLLEKIARRDLAHIRAGDSVVIPTQPDSEMRYSPFPLYIHSADSVAKLILVSRSVQAIGAYEHGKLVRWGPTSTGKKATPTPPGLYHTNWRSKDTHSTVDESWEMKWYFNLDNLEGISMHEYSLPGYPASHSCVRLLSEDAEWFYYWADSWKLSTDGHVTMYGTPVIIFGDYAYGKTPPWMKLGHDPNATNIGITEIENALNKYLFLPKKEEQHHVRP